MIRDRALGWAAKARVPVILPDQIFWCGDPTYGGRYSTYNPLRRTAFIRPDIDRSGFLHELGHVFDYTVLTEQHRALLRGWLGIPADRHWFWGGTHSPMVPGPEAGCEIFADHYARAAMTRWPKYRRLRKFLKIVATEAGYART